MLVTHFIKRSRQQEANHGGISRDLTSLFIIFNPKRARLPLSAHQIRNEGEFRDVGHSSPRLRVTVCSGEPSKKPFRLYTELLIKRRQNPPRETNKKLQCCWLEMSSYADVYKHRSDILAKFPGHVITRHPASPTAFHKMHYQT